MPRKPPRAPEIENEVFAAVVKRFEKFSEMPGFPKNEGLALLYAKAYARFLYNKPRKHEILGDQDNDIDWLMTEITSTMEFFPKPIVARRIYEEFFITADGLTAAEMTSYLEAD